ncbi:MAG: hypothetical protein CVV55_00065 [Synergistetes bacterium HGW-Synergistetes-2]|nr:MAG: hypothetical protein CVV55_00065 [Synergistetes bacterium HGW-Synergistetes-2]
MKKRIMGMLMMLVLIGVIGALPVMAADPYPFEKDADGTILIDSVEDLTAFATEINDINLPVVTNARLTADIKLNEALNNNPTTNWTTWGTTPPAEIVAWTPIGNVTKPYNGTFDGGGHTISGLYINAFTTANQGLFGYCGGSASINNLNITASYLKGGNRIGGIAGSMGGTITNCQVEANVVGMNPVGGVVGWLGGSITGCSHSGSMEGVQSVGGVVGLSGNPKGWISNCYNTGVVSGSTAVGGIVGSNYGSLPNCYNTGVVSGSTSVGGIVGSNDGSLTNCYNTGVVSGSSRVGGITGLNDASLANCYNTGIVTGGDAFTGGVAGKNWGSGNITNCYYLTGSAVYGASSTPALGIGYTTADTADQTVAKSVDDFASGEVAWRLQNGQADQAAAVWGQKLPFVNNGDNPSADLLPVLKATDRVYQLTLMKGNGTDVYHQQYRNASKTIALAMTAAYSWQDAGGIIYQEVNDAADHTLIPRIATLPTAEAVYGTRLGAIAFSGGSVPLSGWSWSGTDTELAQIPAVGNAVGYPATYTAADDLFGIQTVTITPTIKSAGGGGGYTPPSLSGITVTPRAISFDPSGQLLVDISGAPAGATVYYSLDGSSYSTTPPTMTRAGEQRLYLKITCPGYQDFTTQTMVTVAKQLAPEIPIINAAVSGGQPAGSTDLGALLPADRGLTQYQLGPVNDPGGLLNGAPSIDANGVITYGFRHHLAKADEAVTAVQADDGLAQGDASGAATAAAKTVTITVLVSMENYQDTTLTLVLGETEPLGVRYLTHIQDIGWETDWVTAGALSGTSGQSKRLEALKIELTGDLPADASIDTAVHVQNQGDLGPFAMGTAAGTSGLGLRLENICLTLHNLPGYSLRYNVHVQNQGWLRDEADRSRWFTSGEVAGTAALGLRLEGLRIELVKDE